MRILLVCPSARAQATGNVSTAERVKSHLCSTSGMDCILSDPAEIAKDSSECCRKQYIRFVRENQVDGVLFLHAYKSAQISLCDRKDKNSTACCRTAVSIPYGIIFGGTDLNVDILDSGKCEVIVQVLGSARFTVAFNEHLQNISKELLPSTEVFIQPQAVDLLDLNANCTVPQHDASSLCNCHVFVMVTGIRAVKDPMFLLDAFVDWSYSSLDYNVKLLIIGPVLDEKYSGRFFQHLQSLRKKYECPSQDNLGSGIECINNWMKSGGFPILYAPPLQSDDLNKLMTKPQVFASVNSSESEGMSLAIIEAMANKLPVLARSNPGNKSLVVDGQTGLLFNTAEEFIAQSKKLIESETLRYLITKNAYLMVSEEYSFEKERNFYKEICRKFYGSNSSTM